MKIRIFLVTFLAVVLPGYAAIDAGALEGSKDNGMTVESPGASASTTEHRFDPRKRRIDLCRPPLSESRAIRNRMADALDEGHLENCSQSGWRMSRADHSLR